jgi:hypothetical protein
MRCARLLSVVAVAAGCEAPAESLACAIPGEEAEVVACEGGAYALALDDTSVYWISGWGAHPDITPNCELNICRTPGVYTVSHEGGEPDLLVALEGTPRSLALGPSIVASSTEGLWEVGYRGGSTRLDAGLPELTLVGGALHWVQHRDSTVWRANLPSDIAAPRTRAHEADAPISAIVATDAHLVWSTWPIDARGSRVGGIVAKPLDRDSPFVVADDQDLVAKIVIDGQHAVWRAHDEIWHAPLAADDPPRRLAKDVTAMTVHDGFVYYGTLATDGIGLHRIALPAGEGTSLVEYEFDTARTVMSIAVHDDWLYWSDARLMRKPLAGIR